MKIKPQYVNVAIIVFVIGAFIWAFSTRYVPAREPVEVEPWHGELHELSQQLEAQHAVHEQSLSELINRLVRIEKAISAKSEPQKPLIESPGELEAPECPETPSDAPERPAIENVAPTIRLYTADATWHCGPCSKQKRLLAANPPTFKYDVIECPRDGASPSGRYPCWTITKDGKTTSVPGVHTTDVLTKRFMPAPVKPAAVGQYWTLQELRSWINANYNRNTRLNADVTPRSGVWRHLQDYRHNFRASQVTGLKQWEALALHSAVHDGRIGPRR